ncbi:uncharacterized protein LOC106170429 isoform X2 [Lingula anatina]|uniref:Uncharacterized protein LOC106170429 isoform X2 n=1 Tax=Lingula anatina TaxID=7574 RepID=A0A1S3J665_LINAN|nr:uncharacterized protein LOC106170429 isoform X2 [Lingula anatina]|eukprot:XP_013405741.1 uncharacterized protein LOC106170429 isoform X2 [Lingula anatina]
MSYHVENEKQKLKTCMNKMSALPWETFIQANLLATGVVNGVAVLTKSGQCAFLHGRLYNLEKVNWKQFLEIFQYSSEKHNDQIFENGFRLQFPGQREIQYKVYQKTYCSAYATSQGNQEGLIVCNLPYGILISTFSYPQVAAVAVKVVENFCDKLRA